MQLGAHAENANEIFRFITYQTSEKYLTFKCDFKLKLLDNKIENIKCIVYST